jgi:hypothetical protein
VQPYIPGHSLISFDDFSVTRLNMLIPTWRNFLAIFFLLSLLVSAVDYGVGFHLSMDYGYELALKLPVPNLTRD